jgi:hypothetical protein
MDDAGLRVGETGGRGDKKASKYFLPRMHTDARRCNVRLPLPCAGTTSTDFPAERSDWW